MCNHDLIAPILEMIFFNALRLADAKACMFLLTCEKSLKKRVFSIILPCLNICQRM